MRSLRYILGGRPHTLDDCLDRARNQPPDKVTLDVTTDEFVGDLRILRQFVALYQWGFADCNLRCAEVCASLSLPVSPQERRSSLAAANAKLLRRVQEIQRRGIEVVGADRRFERSESLCERT